MLASGPPIHQRQSAGEQQAAGDQLTSRCAHLTRKVSGEPSSNNKQLLELIDAKFNQLAKKILDELRQSQHSRTFCQALDAALNEPAGSTNNLTGLGKPVRSAHFRPARHRRDRDREQDQYQEREAEPAGEQPRSLPVGSWPAPEPSRPARPVSAAAAPPKGKRVSPESERHAYPLIKSATTGDAPLRRTAGLGPFAPSIAVHPLLAKIDKRPRETNQEDEDHEFEYEDDDEDEREHEDDEEDEDLDEDLDLDQTLVPKQQAADAQKEDDPFFKVDRAQRPAYNLNHEAHRKPVIAIQKTYSDKQASENKPVNQQATTFTRPHSVQQMVEKHQQKQQPSLVQPARQRFNPIQRSNTLGSAGHSRPTNWQQQVVAATGGQESDRYYQANEVRQRPVVQPLSKRDIGSLYKPHMNYSTSVLGTHHRLSDDDEIIIIPTQSPSLISSTSPDMNLERAAATMGAGNEESGERFSISRTKSFWEKLSKGNHGRRSHFQPSAGLEMNDFMGGKQSTANQQHQCQAPNSYGAGAVPDYKISPSGANNIRSTTNGEANNSGIGVHRTSSRASTNGKKHHLSQQQQQQQHHHQKPDASVRQTTNAPMSHNLDRMDSTGGSNSNYSCSSSGDENSGPHSQQHNPVIGQIQEMSRQNRFRQTR